MVRLIAGLRAHRVAVNVAAGAVCFALFGFAVWSQDHWGLQPCPLCIFQRVAIVALGVAFLLAAVLALPRARIAGFLAVLLVVLAAGAAVYIQSQPPGTIPECGANDLGYLFDIFPAIDVVKKVLTASGECAKIDWVFLGITMPAWVLIWALALGALGVVLNWPARRAG
jgi:protein dithiol:quinone oxidoreductase